MIFLVTRYVLILAAGWLASTGLAFYDEAAQSITFQIADLANVFAGSVAFLLAIGGRAMARVKGWLT